MVGIFPTWRSPVLDPTEVPGPSSLSSTQGSASNLTRDRDLISTDEHLTNEALDDLWTWYQSATKGGVDPQLVFVKMINSARKPYVDYIANSEGTHTTPASPRGRPKSELLRFWQWGSGSNASDTCYTPSETTVTDHDHPPNYTPDDAMSTRTMSVINSPPPIVKPATPVRVVIKSIHFRDRYVSMNGSRVKSYMNGGGGHVKVQTFIGGWETFELIHHPENNIVSFKATEFDNVYLRADVQGLGRGHTPGHGGGLINCQYGCGKMEKFRLCYVGNQGEVAIEPAESPGRFFRVDGNWLHGMNMQGTVSAWEKFWIVVVPS